MKISLVGYRKTAVAVLAFLGTGLMLCFGYDVSKLAWLATPLSAFFGANLVEHIPNILDKLKGLKNEVPKSE